MTNKYRFNFNRRDLLKSCIAIVSSAAAGLYAPFGWSRQSDENGRRPDRKLRPIRRIENLWIPMSDGTRLAARVWMPVDAESSPVPAVVEYIPYRKRDLNRLRDDYVYTFTAKHGYACLRVDIRGSGESEGLLDDEYLQQEQNDALEFLRWIAAQPWCTGSIGMRGKSWSGFNALQIAARQPPELKAIVTHCSSDDRFIDDAHYIGGSLSQGNFGWGQTFMNVLSLPPDPEIFGKNWKKEWLQRLKNVKPVTHEWTRHQTKDAFWQHGSVSENYDDIRCPVYAVGGYIDSYTNVIPRLLRHLAVPKKGFIGPQGHQFPDQSDPGPGIDFLSEEIRWWDHWLKGMKTSITDEPMLQAYMQEQTPGQVYPANVPGRWVAEQAWPSSRIIDETYFLNASGLSRQADQSDILTLRPDFSVGITNLARPPFAMESELPRDQTEDDLKSLTFDSEILNKNVEILGQPVARLMLSADKPVARVAIRLNEITKDGTSWNVTSGFLNLTHRNGHESPEALEQGKFYSVELPLDVVGYRFKAGCRIRVSISESYWPMIWPSPEPVILNLRTAESHLVLPVRPRGAKELEDLEFSPPTAGDKPQIEEVEPGTQNIERFGPDAAGNISIKKYSDTGMYKLTETGTKTRMVNGFTSRINRFDPGRASWEGSYSVELVRNEWNIKTQSDFEMTSDSKTYFLKTTLIAYEKGEVVFANEWTDSIPRNLA